MSVGRTTADLAGWRVGIERLRVSKSPVGPCYKELLLGKGSARCGDDVVIGVIAEVRDNVRRDSVPVAWCRCHQHVTGCSRRKRTDINGSIYVRDRCIRRSATVERDIQVTIGIDVAQGRQHVPPTGSLIDAHRRSLDRGREETV